MMWTLLIILTITSEKEFNYARSRTIDQKHYTYIYLSIDHLHIYIYRSLFQTSSKWTWLKENQLHAKRTQQSELQIPHNRNSYANTLIENEPVQYMYVHVMTLKLLNIELYILYVHLSIKIKNYTINKEPHSFKKNFALWIAKRIVIPKHMILKPK
jgi:hypothetical protein